jgi:hypothetical protein
MIQNSDAKWTYHTSPGPPSLLEHTAWRENMHVISRSHFRESNERSLSTGPDHPSPSACPLLTSALLRQPSPPPICQPSLVGWSSSPPTVLARALPRYKNPPPASPTPHTTPHSSTLPPLGSAVQPCPLSHRREQERAHDHRKVMGKVESTPASLGLHFRPCEIPYTLWF